MGREHPHHRSWSQVSTEVQGRAPKQRLLALNHGAPNAQGKKNHMDKSLLSRRALVNLTLWGMFLAPTGTSAGDLRELPRVQLQPPTLPTPRTP